MSLLVDTSVWSLALRRDSPKNGPEVTLLQKALNEGGRVVTTGLILQELLQGFDGPKAKRLILREFGALPFIVPEQQDHVAAAGIRNTCRRGGLQIGTIDALLAQLAIHHKLQFLTTDRDFDGIAERVPLSLAGG